MSLPQAAASDTSVKTAETGYNKHDEEITVLLHTNYAAR